MTRVIAAAAILVLPSRMIASRASAALVMIASFAFEGHTASSETRTALGTGALLIHVMAVHWWLGALYPLLALARNVEPVRLGAVAETFGRQAVWVVAALLVGGALVLAILTGARLNLESPYQQRFLLKVVLVAVLLSIAAWNKLRLTPLLRRNPESGRTKLRRSIKREILVGLLILVTTAWALNSSPEG
jgi:putative copper resistance protein D